MNYHKIKIVEYHRSTDLRNSTIFFGAQDWIRTSTSLRTLRPEHSASTNFATWAGVFPIPLSRITIGMGCKYKAFCYLLNYFSKDLFAAHGGVGLARGWLHLCLCDF